MANKWIQNKVSISSKYTEEERVAIGLDIVRFIRERTLKGKGKDGVKFPGYSKAYKDSVDFRIGRKNRNLVNLKLSGDMLEAITLLETKKGKIVYGVDEGDDNAGKVEGNVRGSYGGAPNEDKARPFLDLSVNEIGKILKKYPLTDKEAREERTQTVLDSKLASKVIIDEITDDDE